MADTVFKCMRLRHHFNMINKQVITIQNTPFCNIPDSIQEEFNKDKDAYYWNSNHIINKSQVAYVIEEEIDGCGNPIEHGTHTCWGLVEGDNMPRRAGR